MKIVMSILLLTTISFRTSSLTGATKTPTKDTSMNSETILWTDGKDLTLKIFSGPEAKKYINEIAHMRISIFKEFPYLYEGSIEYERGYLETYFQSQESVISLLFEKENVVGYASAIPLEQEFAEIQKSFIDAGLNVKEYLYVGELMLQKPQQGLGFFNHWKNFGMQLAKDRGFKYWTGMTVDRPENHPLKPAGYIPLDTLWKRCGAIKDERLKATIPWKQIDTQKEEVNTLSFWIVDLAKS